MLKFINQYVLSSQISLYQEQDFDTIIQFDKSNSQSPQRKVPNHEKTVSTKDEPSKVKKPKNIKKLDKKRNQEESDQDSNFDENLQSFSDVSDSNEDKQTESLDDISLEDFSSEDYKSDSEDEKEFKRQSPKQKKSQIKLQEEILKSNQIPTQLEKFQKTQILERQNQNRKKIQEIQKIRLQKYLKRPGSDIITVKSSDQNVQNIKLESNETFSVVPQPSQVDSQQQSFFSHQTKVKIDNSDAKSTISFAQSQKSQYLSYLVKVMNGNLTQQDLQFRKKQQQKRLKLQEKIKQLQKRKLQQKLKKQYDSRSQSGMKILSTNQDSIYDKEQHESFRMPPKNQIQSIKAEGRESGISKNGRKKRTKVTAQMLSSIIKDFQYMAKQQNGLISGGPRITFKQIGRKYHLGRSSIMKMYSDYCKDPTMKRRFQRKQPMSHNRTMMQLTKRRITFIEKLIRKNCTLSQREIAAEMNNHDDLKCKRKKRPDQTTEEYMKNPYHMVAYKAVSRLMKIGNFTRKKVTLIPKNRNSDRTIEQRYNFCKILNELIQDPRNKLYFLDECRFNLFTSRDWGWAPKGQLATKVRHNSKGKDVMLLAIIGKQGLVGHQISDSYIRGSFTIAVNKLINSIIPEVVPQGQRIYLILDNCPIHNKDNLKQMESKKPLTILYLPPYSPMLNPIESWFGELKRIIRSKIYKTRQAMRNELAQTLETYKNKSLENYYKGIEKYIALGLKKQLYRGNTKF